MDANPITEEAEMATPGARCSGATDVGMPPKLAQLRQKLHPPYGGGCLHESRMREICTSGSTRGEWAGLRFALSPTLRRSVTAQNSE